MSKLLSLSCVEKPHSIPVNLGERERERERESILRAKIQQLRNEIREKFLELYATILKLYQIPLQGGDFNEMRTFELLKESIFTFRDDKPENKLFKFLGNICV